MPSKYDEQEQTQDPNVPLGQDMIPSPPHTDGQDRPKAVGTATGQHQVVRSTGVDDRPLPQPPFDGQDALLDGVPPTENDDPTAEQLDQHR